MALNASVTLNGAPFFENGFGSGQIVSPDTVVDGTFLPRSTAWDQGAVWWDSHDGQDRDIRLDLSGVFQIESLVIQADDNDAYILYYWDLQTQTWKLAWDVPNYDAYGSGMQTRPNPEDDTQRYALSTPIVTNALKFEGNMNDGDRYFSVSEIQAFGSAVDDVTILRAVYINLLGRLVVTATSSDAPSAQLSLEVPGQFSGQLMTYHARSGRYLAVVPSAANLDGQTAIVRSDGGGEDTSIIQ